MKKRWPLTSVVAFLCCARLAAADIAIVGATVIDGTGREPVRDAAILIRDDRIVAVGRRGSVVIPVDAQRIKASGKFVIPGLMDANVHLISGLDPEFLIRYEGRYEEVILEAAQVALKNGLTTVFDSYGPRRALIAVREQINAGRVPGSRLFLAGNIVGISSPVSGDFMHGTGGNLSLSFRERMDETFVEGMGADLAWRTPEQVRLAVREYLKKDIDFLKYLASGHMDMKAIMFSAAAQRAMVEEVHAVGKTIQTHTTSVESLRMAIDAGVDLLQHCDVTGPEPIPESSLQLLAKTQMPCATLAYTARRVRDWHVAKFPQTEWTTINKIKEQNDRALVRIGANVLLSTDAGLRHPDAYTNPTAVAMGFVGGPDDPLLITESHFNWLIATAEMGMKPMDLLRAATIQIARAYRLDKELGTLEVGKLADLLVLDQNPLESAMNYRSISLVMKGGQVVDRGALPTHKVLTTVPEPNAEPSS